MLKKYISSGNKLILKTLLIKSQQTTNESSNEMLKIKDKILGLEEHVNKIETQIKENEEIHENIFNSFVYLFFKLSCQRNHFFM